MSEQERPTMQLPGYVGRSLVVLCTGSFLVYLLHSRAAETYVATYMRVLRRIVLVLGS